MQAQWNPLPYLATMTNTVSNNGSPQATRAHDLAQNNLLGINIQHKHTRTKKEKVFPK